MQNRAMRGHKFVGREAVMLGTMFEFGIEMCIVGKPQLIPNSNPADTEKQFHIIPPLGLILMSRLTTGSLKWIKKMN